MSERLDKKVNVEPGKNFDVKKLIRSLAVSSSQNDELVLLDMKLPKVHLETKLGSSDKKVIHFIRQILVWGASHDLDLQNRGETFGFESLERLRAVIKDGIRF